MGHQRIGSTIHDLCGLWPASKPDDSAIIEAALSLGIEILGNKLLSCMDHQVLDRAFMV